MPFQFEPYRSDLTGTIADIMGRSAQIQGDAAMRAAAAQARAAEIKGENTARLLGGFGDLASRTAEGVGQYFADAPRRQQLQQEKENEAWLRQRLSSGTPPTFPELAGKLGHERALAINNGLRQLSQDVLNDEQRTREEIARDALAIKHLPAGMKQEAWAARVGEWQQAGAPANLFPGQYDDQLADSLIAWATGKEPPRREGFTLTPGAKRFDADGKEIASVAEPPKKREVVVRGPNGRPVRRLVDETQLEAGVEEYERPREPQQPPAPIVIPGPSGPLLLDPRANRTTPVAGPDGQPLPAAPTADMRNKGEGRKLVEKSDQALRKLSERVINKRGVAQRATAAGRSVEAALGNDPEYRTYQDARMALAGNLAVAQQGSRVSDADVKAIWLPMVPDVFRDTDESSLMKWGLIDEMSGIQSKPHAGPQTVRMRAPNGQEQDVAPDQVEHYKSLGATVVKQ